MSLPQRQCLLLQGENDWLLQQAQAVFHRVEAEQRCWLSDEADRPTLALGSKQAVGQLGRDNSLVIFDARAHFSADAFGALIGTLRAGGLIMVLLAGDEQKRSRWLARFLRRASLFPAIQTLAQGDDMPQWQPPDEHSQPFYMPTDEQAQAIQAVLRVVSGHRRRPLVVSSDRGRGKTALLGMAAAALLKQGKSQILVTAPAPGNIQTLLQHARQQLPGSVQTRHSVNWEQGRIEFIAPDALLRDRPPCDLLIVDEAAAIPASMLAQMLEQYSRMVFSTTLHGYEGTGRGFTLRFRKTLDALTPDWRALTLTEPIRWAADDKLEQFSFDALMLDAEPVDDALITEVAEATFSVLGRAELAADETRLREVFGLMVLAHYRTKPSDLQMMLDRDDIAVAVLRQREHIIATAWLVDEPPIPEALAKDIFDGQRRLKGQLLPQSLLAHAGLADAGLLRYWRVIRIAVHPALQGKGLGSLLLTHILQQARGQQDLVGSSFAMETDILRFWRRNDFLPVRLGQHRDEVTGSVSLMMLRAVSEAGENLLQQAVEQFRGQWPFLLQRQLADLPAEQVGLLSLPAGQPDSLSPTLRRQMESFAYARRSYESSEFALWQWFQSRLSAPAFQQLPQHDQATIILLIMQRREIAEVVTKLGYSGRAELMDKLRQIVSDSLSAASSAETR